MNEMCATLLFGRADRQLAWPSRLQTSAGVTSCKQDGTQKCAEMYRKCPQWVARKEHTTCDIVAPHDVLKHHQTVTAHSIASGLTSSKLTVSLGSDVVRNCGAAVQPLHQKKLFVHDSCDIATFC